MLAQLREVPNPPRGTATPLPLPSPTAVAVQARSRSRRLSRARAAAAALVATGLLLFKLTHFLNPRVASRVLLTRLGRWAGRLASSPVPLSQLFQVDGKAVMGLLGLSWAAPTALEEQALSNLNEQTVDQVGLRAHPVTGLCHRPLVSMIASRKRDTVNVRMIVGPLMFRNIAECKHKRVIHIYMSYLVPLL